MSELLLVGVTGGELFVVLLVFLAVGALALALLLVFAKSPTDIEQRLTEYGTLEVAGGVATGVGGRAPRQLAESRVVRGAVDFTGRVVGRLGLLDRIETLLEQADLPLRPAEALFFYVAGVVIVALFALVVFPSAAVALVVALGLALVPAVLVSQRRRRRLRAFDEALPDALNLLAGSMRAGFSLVQGVSAVADEAPEPMRSELLRACNENRLGRPIEDALDDVANRMASSDLGWTVLAVRIQREVGGNLAELLNTVADTMTQRERVRREIRALTAEGRLSALVLSVFPWLLGGVLFIIRPSYIRILFHNGWGIASMIAAIVLAVIGWFWLRRILEIEV